MTACVIDINVAIVANDFRRVLDGHASNSPQADNDCRIICVERLTSIVENGIVVIDDAGELLAQYRDSLSGSGQPGLGDAFFRHLFERQYDVQRVRRVALSRNANGEFDEFPEDPELANFDRSDRIYIALAKADLGRSNILNAVDSDYDECSGALKRNGIIVEELCPQCLVIKS